MKKLILALCLVTSPAMANSWFSISLDGNRCQTMQDFGEEIMRYGGLPMFSPQELMNGLRFAGAAPDAQTTTANNGMTVTIVSWTSPMGEHLNRIFYTTQRDCQAAVERAIAAGIVPAPNSLGR